METMFNNMAYRGMCFGHWGEASRPVDGVVRAIAHSACKRTPAQGPVYKSRDTQENMVASHLRHVLAVTAVRASARLLLARVPLVGTDTTDALRRAAVCSRAHSVAVQALTEISALGPVVTSSA